MSPKNKWLNKIEAENDESTVNISWNSSGSDSEALHEFTKRRKRTTSRKCTKSNTNIDLKQIEVSPILWKKESLLNNLQHRIDSPILTQLQDRLIVGNSPILNNRDVSKLIENSNINLKLVPESPILWQKESILNSLQYREESPILSQCKDRCIRETSPIISNRDVVRRIKISRQKAKILKIAIKDSPESYQICNTQSQRSPTPQISQDPTQRDTTVLEISQSNSECSTSSCNYNHSTQDLSPDSSNTFINQSQTPYYYEPPPQKPRYKKGTLSSQLFKVLNAQKASAAIWEHERFLNKPIEEALQKSAIPFYLVSEKTEYGCRVLNCRYQENNVTFLIMLENSLEIEFKLNNLYNLLEPYRWKTMKYQGNEVKCYFNARKFIPDIDLSVL